MKKRIWMLMLTMMLCMSLTATASAAIEEFIRIGDQTISDLNLSGEDWQYIPDECKLRLENAVIEYNQYQAAIIATMKGKPLTIELVGENTVRYSNPTSADLFGIEVQQNDLKIVGDGSLTIEVNAPLEYEDEDDKINNCYGISVHNGDLVIDADVTAKVTIAGVAARAAALRAEGDIVIEGGQVNAYLNHNGSNPIGGRFEEGAAIYVDGNNHQMTINDGTVNAYAGTGTGDSCGIGTQVMSSIVINNGTVNAYGSNANNSYGIGVGFDGHITINGGTIKARAGEAQHSSYGIGTNSPLTITDGTIDAVGGKAGVDSYGIGGNMDVSISNSKIHAVGGAAGGRSFGIGATGDVSITDSSIAATGGTANYSYGFGSQEDIKIFGASNVLEAAGGTLAVGSLGATTAPASGYRYTVNTTGNSKDNQKLNSMPNWKLYKYVLMEPGEHIEDDNTEDEYIEEEISELPKTGDDSALMLWTMLLALCGTAMLLRRHREN